MGIAEVGSEPVAPTCCGGRLDNGCPSRGGPTRGAALGGLPDRAGGPAELESQPRPVRITDVDDLPVADVYRQHLTPVNEHSIERAVVDRHPLAVFEAQHHMCPRHQRMGQANIGSQITSDHHVMTRREGAF